MINFLLEKEGGAFNKRKKSFSFREKTPGEEEALQKGS